MSLKSTFVCALGLGAVLAMGLVPTVEAAPRKKMRPQPMAAVSGLAAMHTLSREGGRTCFADHFHYGSSVGQRTVKAAQSAAVASWADFVIFEYDPSWASFGKASSKEMKCSQSTGGWSCDASARPCR